MESQNWPLGGPTYVFCALCGFRITKDRSTWSREHNAWVHKRDGCDDDPPDPPRRPPPPPPLPLR